MEGNIATRPTRLGIQWRLEEAWVRRFKTPLDPQVGWPGRYINVRPCGGLPMALLQLKDPFELFLKRREFLPRFQVSVSWQYDSNCRKRRKKPIPSFRPSKRTILAIQSSKHLTRTANIFPGDAATEMVSCIRQVAM